MYPLGEVVWYPGGDITSNRLKHGTLSLLQHRAPALAMDLVSSATGKKPMYVNLFYYPNHERTMLRHM